MELTNLQGPTRAVLFNLHQLHAPNSGWRLLTGIIMLLTRHSDGLLVDLRTRNLEQLEQIENNRAKRAEGSWAERTHEIVAAVLPACAKLQRQPPHPLTRLLLHGIQGTRRFQLKSGPHDYDN